MARFYDPADQEDLDRVEKALRCGGIEYYLVDEPEPGLGSHQVHVAEEDIAEAERLLARSLH